MLIRVNQSIMCHAMPRYILQSGPRVVVLFTFHAIWPCGWKGSTHRSGLPAKNLRSAADFHDAAVVEKTQLVNHNFKLKEIAINKYNKFNVKSLNNLLPNKDNLLKWNISQNNLSEICSKILLNVKSSNHFGTKSDV